MLISFCVYQVTGEWCHWLRRSIILIIRAATYKAFREPLRGEAHLNLYMLMQSMRDITAAYNHSLSIFSSSGGGKTRTVDGVAELLFCFPFNVREDLSVEGQFSTPPSFLYCVMRSFDDCLGHSIPAGWCRSSTMFRSRPDRRRRRRNPYH